MEHPVVCHTALEAGGYMAAEFVLVLVEAETFLTLPYVTWVVMTTTSKLQ